MQIVIYYCRADNFIFLVDEKKVKVRQLDWQILSIYLGQGPKCLNVNYITINM